MWGERVISPNDWASWSNRVCNRLVPHASRAVNGSYYQQGSPSGAAGTRLESRQQRFRTNDRKRTCTLSTTKLPKWSVQFHCTVMVWCFRISKLCSMHSTCAQTVSQTFNVHVDDACGKACVSHCVVNEPRRVGAAHHQPKSVFSLELWTWRWD